MCKNVNNHLSPGTAIMKLKEYSSTVEYPAHKILMIVPENKVLDFLERAGDKRDELARLLNNHRYAYRDQDILAKLDELASPAKTKR